MEIQENVPQEPESENSEESTPEEESTIHTFTRLQKQTLKDEKSIYIIVKYSYDSTVCTSKAIASLACQQAVRDTREAIKNTFETLGALKVWLKKRPTEERVISKQKVQVSIITRSLLGGSAKIEDKASKKAKLYGLGATDKDTQELLADLAGISVEALCKKKGWKVLQ